MHQRFYYIWIFSTLVTLGLWQIFPGHPLVMRNFIQLHTYEEKINLHWNILPEVSAAHLKDVMGRNI